MKKPSSIIKSNLPEKGEQILQSIKSEYYPNSVEECHKLIARINVGKTELILKNIELQKEKEFAENQLQRHLNFYEYAPSGYFTLNRAGIILELNRSAGKFIGTEACSLEKRPFHDFLTEESSAIFNVFFNKIFEFNEKVTCEIKLKTEDHSFRIVQIEGISVSDGDVCLIDMIDISDRIRVSQKLMESEQKYRLLIEKLNEGIGILDINESFIFANSAAELIFEVSNGELLNRNLNEFLSVDQIKILKNNDERKVWSEKSSYEVDIILLKGKTKTLAISGTPYLDNKGGQTSTLTLFTDISDKKRDEQRLKRRLKLEHILSIISTDFVHSKSENIDQLINLALQRIGTYAAVDRSYVFLFSEDELYFSNTHEWCNIGIEPQIDNRIGISIDVMPLWMEKLKRFETIHIPSVSVLPIDIQSEKYILEYQNIKSLIIIPISLSDKLFGFLGFDSLKEEKNWEEEDILLLKMLGEIFGNGLNRIKAEIDLKLTNLNLERKVIERTKEIKQLWRLNRAIVDHVDLIVISTDQNGIIKSFNPFSEQVLEYKAEEVIDKHTIAIFFNHEEIIKKAKDLSEYSGHYVPPLVELLFNPNLKYFPEGNEWTFVRKNGTVFKVLLTISQLDNENGKILGYVCVAFDITERKHSEELLQASERENRAIVSAVPDILFKIQKDGTCLDFQNQIDSAHFITGKMFHGRKIEEIVPAELAKIFLSMLGNAFRTKEVIQNEYEYSNSGVTRFYEIRVIAISEDEVLSIIRDITDRKTTESTLKWNESFLRLMTSSSPLAFFVVDNRTDEILYFNHRFCEIWGITHLEEKMSGKLLKNNDIIPHCLHMLLEVQSFADSCKPLQHEDNRITIEDQIPFIDGRIIRRFSTQIRGENDEYYGRFYIFEDITERKQTEYYLGLQRDLGIGLSAATNMQETLELSMNTLMQTGIANCGGIYLMNNQTGNLDLSIHRNLSENFIEHTACYTPDTIQLNLVMKGESIFGLYSKVIQQDTQFLPDDGYNYIAILPIQNEGKVFGSLNLGSNNTNEFSTTIKHTLEAFTNQIGAAIARILAEEAFRTSQRNFHLMFNKLDDFMFILDMNGNIIKTNPIVQKRLGYSEEELINMHVLAVHPPARREEADRLVNEMLTGQASFCPIPLMAKNGTMIPVETRVVLGIWDGKDALYGISRDISERIKAEESLRKSEQRWQFALEGSGDGIWDWNFVSNEVFFSKQWKAMLGYSESEIENKFSEWENRIFPDDLNQRIFSLNKHFRGDTEIYINEHRFKCKDGNYKWILERGKVIDWLNDGKPSRMIGTQTDITPGKQLEAQLIKSIEKEKELNDLKSRFVSNASHEFRTPLASILMVSDTLILHQQKMDQIQIAARLGKIKDHVFHMINIVNDVLQISKMHEGKIEFNPIEEDMIILIQNIIEGFDSSILVNGNIEFRSPFESIKTRIDHRLMIHAINNLISNAIKYSGSDPMISLELSLDNNELLLSISDHGIGIPEEDQKYLFTPFFRAGNTNNIQGNGLGLSIVRDSIQMHGGKITFKSESKKGSTFTLHFPRSIVVGYTNFASSI